MAQLHGTVRKDPWVQSVLLAGGLELDALAERILDLSTFENAETMRSRSLALWEKIMDITPEPEAAMAERRRAVMTRWLIASPPSLEVVQALCDALYPGELEAGYDNGYLVLWRKDTARIDYRPAGRAIEDVKPAHIMLTVGDRRYLGVSGISMEYHTGDITVSVPEGE